VSPLTAVTDPLPEPDVGARVSPPVVVAVQSAGAHPAGVVVTFTTCEPPVDAKLTVAGEIANEHAGRVGVGCVVSDDLGVPLHESSAARRAPAVNDRKSWRRMRIFYALDRFVDAAWKEWVAVARGTAAAFGRARHPILGFGQ
jgi:hypothetical protein